MRTHPGRRFFGSCLCCDYRAIAPVNAGRRRVLSGLAATGIGASAAIIAGPRSTSAQPRAMGKPALIDIHHHIVPPFYLAENRERIAGSRGGQISPAWLEWTPAQALDAMDRHNVGTAVLSLSTPGVWFGDVEAARRTARHCNDYAAELSRSHPHRLACSRLCPCRTQMAACGRSSMPWMSSRLMGLAF